MKKSNINRVIKIIKNNVNWEALSEEIFKKIVDNPKEVGKWFAEFLQNNGNAIVNNSEITHDKKSLLWRMKNRLPESGLLQRFFR